MSTGTFTVNGMLTTARPTMTTAGMWINGNNITAITPRRIATMGTIPGGIREQPALP